MAQRATAQDSIQGGAIYSLPAGSSDTITTISGAFRVPDASIPLSGPTANHQGVYAFSIWVGIGGWNDFYGTASACPAGSGVLRAGIDVYYDGFEDVPMQPVAWYQYGVSHEGGNFAYAGFSSEPGDLIKITVSGVSSNVTAIIENYGKVNTTVGNTPIQKMPPTFGFQGSEVAKTLCRSEAGWIVENGMSETVPPEPVVLANFTEVVFGELDVSTSSGAKGSATTAKLVNINLPDQGGKLTDCSAPNASELRCRRTLN
ncbi:concanavalin A-like lectin/glucanase domain-containing protein [Apodospora peruviana]|uniref:Concanavalin A-like lectin/glucanase domain-containing protein n=1 Tax=Apodospora peruviana TaxID=516989 RepID=A0AAE0MEX3_9PEZI|nr:concanavalin A-like lectin/glucanase domain-containing protein [Apodospora peruviana]